MKATIAIVKIWRKGREGREEEGREGEGREEEGSGRQGGREGEALFQAL